MEKLPRQFYSRDTISVARDLLGKHLYNRAGGVEKIGRIVEVEAYLGPKDLASHASRGLTHRTRIMFGPPGFAYIYLVYGMHWCMNVVTEPVGQACAVLLRALEPVWNVEGNTSGPGRLCKAMSIDGSYNGADLESDNFHIASAPETTSFGIATATRIGVEYSGPWASEPLRFYIRDNKFVSKGEP